MQVCKLDDIPVSTAHGFVIGQNNIFIVRTAQHKIAAYLNRCPHMRVPLNWEENRFMDNDGSFIRCATHGAMFEPDTGMCILGPCRGESLWQLACTIENGNIHVDVSELPDSDSTLNPEP